MGGNLTSVIRSLGFLLHKMRITLWLSSSLFSYKWNAWTRAPVYSLNTALSTKPSACIILKLRCEPCPLASTGILILVMGATPFCAQGFLLCVQGSPWAGLEVGCQASNRGQLLARQAPYLLYCCSNSTCPYLKWQNNFPVTFLLYSQWCLSYISTQFA